MQKGILLLFVFAASAVCQQKSVKGCFTYDAVSKKCRDCYRRHVTASGVCGPLLPVTDTCLIHGGQTGTKDCSLCRPGYARTTDGDCTAKDVFNCIDLQPYFGNKYRCLTCGSGQYPNTITGQCGPIANAKDAVANCLWGLNYAGRIGCTKCIAGYTLNTTIQKCIPQTGALVGCWKTKSDGKTCGACDAFAGYSMQKNGSCKFIKKE